VFATVFFLHRCSCPCTCSIKSITKLNTLRVGLRRVSLQQDGVICSFYVVVVWHTSLREEVISLPISDEVTGFRERSMRIKGSRFKRDDRYDPAIHGSIVNSTPLIKDYRSPPPSAIRRPLILLSVPKLSSCRCLPYKPDLDATTAGKFTANSFWAAHSAASPSSNLFWIT
jgi:hypothetical protein